MRTRLLLFVCLLVAFGAGAARAADRPPGEYVLGDSNAPWEISAQRMSYSEKERLFIAEGSVEITRDGNVLTAERAVYNEETGIVQVSGDVELASNGDVVTGKMAILDLNNYNGQITGGRLFLKEKNFYVSGRAMVRLGPNTYLVRGCRLTSCDGLNPDWSITGSEVRVTVEGYGSVKDAAFRIRGFPVFYLPYALFPVKTKRQSGLLPPRIGYSNRNGLDIELPFFWAVSDQVDATFYSRYMSERGYMQGAELRYLADRNSKGTLLFDVLADRIEEKDLSDPDEVDLSPLGRTNKTRYWLRGKADQGLPGNMEARLDLDYVSDQDYLKEFQGGLYGYQARPHLSEEFSRPTDDIHAQTRRSALRLSHDAEHYSLQGLSSYYQRPENPARDETPQPLLGANYALLPRALSGSPLFVRFGMDYDRVWREEGEKGHRMSLTPEMSYPIWLGRYLEFEPSVSFTRHTQWLDHEFGGIDRQSRNVYQIDARLSSVLERIFDVGWRHAGRVKHKITPFLTYTYRGYDDEDRHRPWFEPIDAEGRDNRITLGFANRLDARGENQKGEVRYYEWGTFGFSQAYNLDEAHRDGEPGRERQPFEPLVGSFSLTPHPDLDLDAEVHWDHYDHGISFADVSLEYQLERAGGRKDSFEIDYQYAKEGYEDLDYIYQYLKGGGESLNCRLHVNLFSGFAVGAAFKRELNLDHNIESGYWLDYQSQCWGLRLITERMDGVDSFMLTVRLRGLGEF